MPFTPTGLNAIMNLLALMLLVPWKGIFQPLFRDLEVLKTQADDKSISIYDPGGLLILLIPKAQITMQGIQAPSSSTSALYLLPNLPALPDHIFAGYLFLCLIDAHGKTSLIGFYQVLLASGQIESIQIFFQDDSYPHLFCMLIFGIQVLGLPDNLCTNHLYAYKVLLNISQNHSSKECSNYF